ncbi:HIT domain-containing protein [Buchnera aphidicola]|uniref:HIT domain-containing protein n=1 Tax=Buchnera aphidicola (Anoecia oenotherae) TaxID=1241833 RepID=A0A4D6XY49_9GAMM|nr:HIT domain-containing protein [Buchnera aphidicola]QCI19404.1 HIT domain-containing protein [Buchnera aphidicola (Anoecia oenotherae)]
MDTSNEKKSIIFKNIILRKCFAIIEYQDELITAFEDKNKLAPIHILIVPNNYIQSMAYVKSKNKLLLGHMLYVATKLAKKFNISKNGYRIIINCNKHGGQEIPYLHIHLLGGKKLSNHFC